MILSIKDPKKREQEVKDFLKTRQNIKHNFEQEKQLKMGFREETEKLFKPITESISEQNIAHKRELNFLGDKLVSNQGKIYQKITQPLAITGSDTKAAKHLQVSELIQKYLSDNKKKSNAIYSIKHNPVSNVFSIGNSVIKFDNNFMEIAGRKYNATEGLMELLIKKDPDIEILTEQDIKDYKEILEKTNAIYQNADPSSKKLASDRSAKWVIISDKLFPNTIKKSGGNLNVIFLPSDPKELINQLQLSLASYSAGNNGEFNKINAILDGLLKMRTITKNDYIKIHKNIFS
jgi:hypothetical protein